MIPTSADVERMGAHRAALVDFAPRSRAARAYADLWEEIRERLRGDRPRGASGRPSPRDST